MSPSQASGGAEGENKYLFISRNSSDTKHCLVSAVSADRGLNMTLTQISSRIYNYILSHLNMKTRRRVMCATFLFDIDTCILPGVFSIWQQCTYLFTLHKPNGLSLTKSNMWLFFNFEQHLDSFDFKHPISTAPACFIWTYWTWGPIFFSGFWLTWSPGQ